MRESEGPRVPSVGLRTKMVGLFSGVLIVFLAAFVLYAAHDQRARLEGEMLEQSRMLVTEMDAVWEFVSINQHTINNTSDGVYDFKSLHCAIAGKAVAVLFSRNSDYSMRFTNLNPRNFFNDPDAYERQALESFAVDPLASEVYGFVDRDGEPVFRYVRTMRYTDDCMECHGEPAGELDPTGYEKEGFAPGDLAGAVSVVVPADLYLANMRRAVVTDVGFYLVLTCGMALIIYAVLSRLVTMPLTRLGEALARFGHGSAAEADGASQACASCAATLAPALPTPPAPPWDSVELDELFDSYRAMAQRLDGLYRSLESQVVERTSQLQAANAQLELERARVEKANERLVRDMRYKSDFLAIVSHELRTPLTSIVAFTDLLAQSIDPSQTDALRQLEEVEKNGAVLLEMVDNILETARIQAGSERLNLELVDLNDIVGMVEAANASVALKRGVAFSTCVDAEVPLITADWEKVRRILVNLVSNAIKFTPGGGRVDVHARYDAAARMVSVAVTDTGIGIPADKQELVFERFTQENMSTVRRYGGSGLGLSLVKDLAHMLGGTVELVSEVGVGSTFTVTLPEDGPVADGIAGSDEGEGLR